MIKLISATLMYLVSISVFSCPNALPTNDPNFCSSFRSVASCYCTTSGLPSGMCQDMNSLYNRMMIVFGTLQKACEYQRYTSTENCINNWNCYRKGGTDSQGNLCSSTMQACQ